MNTKKKTKITAGKKSHKTYKGASFEEIVGKTVEAVGVSTVDGSYGDEPCTVLFFSDGTQHSFVMPSNFN